MPADYEIRAAWTGASANAFTIGESTVGGSDILVGQFSTDFTEPYSNLTAFTLANKFYGTKRIRIDRGRDDNLDPMKAGTCTLVLTDPTGLWNPKNPASPLAGKVTPMRPIRVRATLNGVIYGLFRGFIRRAEHDPSQNVKETTIEAVDLFVWLSRVSPVLAAIGTETTGSAIGRILDAVGFTEAAFRSLSTGDVIPSFSADGTKTALTLIEDLLEAERGTFFVSASGVATYEDRAARARRITSLATFSDSMTDVNPSTDLDRIRNRARVQRAGGVEQVAFDADSAGYYGWADFGKVDTPYLLDDSQAASLAAWLVSQRKDARPPVRGMQFVGSNDVILAQMLTREIGDRVTVTESAGGTSAECHIESITHEITDGGKVHRTSWGLSEREAQQAFLIGTSTVGGTHVLAY